VASAIVAPASWGDAMNATSWLNGLAAIVAVGLAAIIGGHHRAVDDHEVVPPGSVTEVADASGHVTHIRPFARIVAASTLADRLLVELCEPDRVVAFTAFGAAHSPLGYQYAGKPLLKSGADVEKVLALKPDLLITNSFGTPAKMARLREAGIEVFDLGEAHGLDSLVEDARTVGKLVGHPERGERYAEAFTRRFERVAATIPANQRRTAIYLSIYGNQLFGGALGSSYHDILVHAGLIDAAAVRFGNWPKYSPEQIVELDPEVIVTKRGMKSVICERPSFERLRACVGGTVVEVDSEIMDDPGPGMLDVAEAVFASVYGAQH
jgi:iron complex transport system substrate-binding protein